MAPTIFKMKLSAGHILYAEDDEATREFVTYLLTRSYYNVVTAESCGDALRLARIGRFDLYLLDNWIIGGSGLELCQKLRELDSLTPILFYSGAALERDNQEAFAAGAQGYLSKPVGNNELIKEVARIISAANRDRVWMAPEEGYRLPWQ